MARLEDEIRQALERRLAASPAPPDLRTRVSHAATTHISRPRLLPRLAAATATLLVAAAIAAGALYGHLYGRPGPTQSTPAPSGTALFRFPLGGQVVDFYTWDGRLARRLANPLPYHSPTIVSGDGRFYIDGGGRLYETEGGQIGSVADWAQFRTSMWADDSVHICGTTSNTLEVVGIHGDVRRYPLDPKGEVHSVFACSVRSGRAAILEDSGRVLRLVSLHDGTTVGSAAALLGNTNILVSRDARWLARTTIQPDGHAMTNVVDLTDGSTRARYDNISPSAFSPDGTLLMAMDTIGGEARLIDWRTGTAVWSRPAYGMMIPAVSDGATDRLLVALNTTNPRGGSAYDEFWIVDGRGSVRPFHPVP